jgi:hypothetical protein
MDGIIWCNFAGAPLEQALGASGQISIFNFPQQGLYLKSTGGAVTINNSPFDTPPPDGAIMHLVGLSDTDYCIIPVSDTAGGFIGNGDVYLQRYKTLTVVYNAELQRFFEMGRSV